MKVLSAILIVVFVASQATATSPEYVIQCSLSDPKFSECSDTNANNVLKILLKGVLEFVPPFYSFNPGKLDLDANENLYFYSENSATTDNSKYDIFDASYNPETKLLKFILRIGHSEWTVDFIANGTILDKPVLEKGNAKMILDNADSHYEAYLEIKEVDGVKHYHIYKQFKSNTTIEKFEFQTTDQTSVNDPMSSEQRKVWDETVPQLKNAMAKKVDQLGGPIITHVLNVIFNIAPADGIFLA